MHTSKLKAQKICRQFNPSTRKNCAVN